MITSWHNFRDKFAGIGFATLSIMLFLPAALLAQGPTVSGLPEAVTGTQAPVPFTGPTGPEYSTFVVTTPLTGGPINATGNPYNVWCWNAFGYIEPAIESYTAYSSYSSTFQALPGAGTGTPAQIATEWDEVNWVLNNKKGTSGENPTANDINEVIYNLLIPGFATTYNAPLSPDAQALLTDALAHGPGFVPGAGQLLGIALYNAGINPNDGPGSVQDILIEYPLPTVPQKPGIKVTKSASVTTAKCTDKVTYTYTVTNTGNVTLTNVTLIDDNATPTNPNDNITIASGVTLAGGQSQTYTRTLYLPLTEYGVDANNNASQHTLVTKVLPNGNYQVTLLEDLGLVDNSYGVASGPDWGSNGNNPWAHLGADSAEFQFVDGNGNTVLDFAADYVSISNQYPSGVGTAGVTGGAGQLFSGSASNIVSIDTTITDNLNQSQNVGKFYFNSPPPNYAGWNFQCGYTVVIKASCFGKYGFGGCNIKNIQHGQCKTGSSYKCAPKPVCKNITNTVAATGTASVNGTNQTVTASAQATVLLSTGGQTSCQAPPQCQCPCWNCQHGDHQHCQNQKCNDDSMQAAALPTAEPALQAAGLVESVQHEVQPVRPQLVIR